MADQNVTRVNDDGNWTPIDELAKLLAHDVPFTEDEVLETCEVLSTQLIEAVVWSDRDKIAEFANGVFTALDYAKPIIDRAYLVAACRTLNMFAGEMVDRMRPPQQDEWARSDPAIMAIIDVLCAKLMEMSVLADLVKQEPDLVRQIDRMEIGGLVSCEYAAPHKRYVQLTPAGQDLQDAACLAAKKAQNEARVV